MASSTDQIEMKGMLMAALRGFERWEKAGSPKDHDWSNANYDWYHDHINRTADQNVFEFNIQVFDSPEGDTWWNGKFRLIDGIDVEIIESGCERC